MATNEYFQSVLAAQTPADDSSEMKELQTNRGAVEKVLREAFPGAAATVRYGGSKTKGTLILESYDLDVVFYVPNGNNVAGETLNDIFANVQKALAQHYAVEPKTSALRLRDKGRRSNLHIDVVPGRFTDDSKTDCYLHQSNGEKDRLKTNLDVHIKHIRDSGILDALRLLKLLRVRRAIEVKQFAYELLGVKLLKAKRQRPIEEQLDHFFTEITNSEQPITIEDPANPGGNDLSSLLKAAWPGLRHAARSILQQVKASGWEGVLGKPSAVPIADRAPRLEVIRQGTPTATKPWSE
jgi:tRNA nucleotidyltransferase (CCA-adding enzyme)